MCLYVKIRAAGSLKCCHLSNGLQDMISRKTTVLIYTTVRMKISKIHIQMDAVSNLFIDSSILGCFLPFCMQCVSQ